MNVAIMSRCLIYARQIRTDVFGKSVFHPPAPTFVFRAVFDQEIFGGGHCKTAALSSPSRQSLQAEPPERYRLSGTRREISRMRRRRNQLPYLHIFGSPKDPKGGLLYNRRTEKPYNWVEAWQSNYQHRHKVQRFMSSCISVHTYLK